MDYAIRKAEYEDMPRILEIYDRARAFMAQQGNPNQWGKTNPPRETLQEDISAGNLYTVENESCIHGVFYFKVGEDPTYLRIFDGKWICDAPYGTIHRIASDGSGGIFAACVAFCSRLCSHLRIDTHEDNRVMQHLITKAGFTRCGIIYIADGTPRIAYERTENQPAKGN